MPIKTTNQFWFWESELPKEYCENIISELFDEKTAVDGTYFNNGESVVGDHRKTKVCWADANTNLGLLLFNHVLLANQKANWLFDIDGIEPVQIGRYGIDGHYDWHNDEPVSFRDGTGTQRKLSVSLLLSDPDTYEGGDFLFKGQEQPLTRKQGSIIVFPSHMEHIVTSVTKGVRYSAVIWARGPYFK
jgi:PKHD-type hydroxylase